VGLPRRKPASPSLPLPARLAQVVSTRNEQIWGKARHPIVGYAVFTRRGIIGTQI